MVCRASTAYLTYECEIPVILCREFVSLTKVEPVFYYDCLRTVSALVLRRSLVFRSALNSNISKSGLSHILREGRISRGGTKFLGLFPTASYDSLPIRSR